MVTFGFQRINYFTDEPDGPVMLIIEVLDGILQRPVEVFFSTIDGTATSELILPADYMSLIDVPLQFDENTQSLTVTVTIVDDNIFEDDEVFLGNLSTFDPAVILNPREVSHHPRERRP